MSPKGWKDEAGEKIPIWTLRKSNMGGRPKKDNGTITLRVARPVADQINGDPEAKARAIHLLEAQFQREK